MASAVNWRVARCLAGLLLVASASALSTQPTVPPCGRAAARTPPSRPAVQPLQAVAAASLSLLLLTAPPQPAFAESATLATKKASEFQGAVEGFEDFAAQGGKMEANPSCFFDECKEQTTSCFTNPVRARPIEPAAATPLPASRVSPRGATCAIFRLAAGLP